MPSSCSAPITGIGWRQAYKSQAMPQSTNNKPPQRAQDGADTQNGSGQADTARLRLRSQFFNCPVDAAEHFAGVIRGDFFPFAYITGHNVLGHVQLAFLADVIWSHGVFLLSLPA